MVSENVKPRNCRDYAKHGIDWLVGYRKKDNKCFFYKLKNYSKIESKSFSVNKHPPDDFPISKVPNSHKKKKGN